MMWSICLVFVFAGLLSLFGCSNNARMASEESVRVIERDAGVIKESSLDYGFLIGDTECKEIASVSANCGCTQLPLREGENLDFSKPFPVNIQLDKNHYGKGHQDFFIRFTDGAALACRLLYEYAPPPFAAPAELLFFEDVSKKRLVLSFPSESEVSIREVTAPAGITWKREPSGEKKHDVCLVFEMDRTLFEGEQTGLIEVVTTSHEKSRFSLPYLVLRP